MKRFLIYAGLMSLVVLATVFAGECMVRRLPNPYKYKHEYMLRHADEVEVLILGSSHTYYGIRPGMLHRRAFSLANQAQDLDYDLFMLEKYVPHSKSLKKVVLPISYFSLFNPPHEERGSLQDINYRVYMDCPYHSFFSKYNLELTNISLWNQKLRRMFGSEADDLSCDSLGWGKRYTKASRIKNWTNSDAAIERHTPKNWDYLDMRIGQLHRIASFCRSRSIDLVLVTMPTYPTYYENLDAKNLEKMYEVIRRFQKEYGLFYKDYTKDPRFTDDDFRDCDHLSDVGAAKFTPIFEQECL